jgi:hypothetical protein
VILAYSAEQVALWLGLYATVVSTATGLLALYGEVFQRVRVGSTEDFVIPASRGRTLKVARDYADEIGVPEHARRPVLSIRVINRGRQPVQVRSVMQARWFRLQRSVFDEPMDAGPAVVEPGRFHDFTIGMHHDYAHGHSLRRIYVVDGADRVHPLRERWLQRVESVTWRWIAVRVSRRRRRRSQRSST